MFTGKRIHLLGLWRFARRNLLRTLLISASVTCLYALLGWKFIAVPFLPIGTIGTAVAFYMGFKNNQAYLLPPCSSPMCWTKRSAKS